MTSGVAIAMRITHEEAVRRLRSTKNLANSIKGSPTPSLSSTTITAPSVSVETMIRGPQGKPKVSESVHDKIHEMAAGGQTQVQIAEVLDLHPNTVSRHLSGKIGDLPPNAERVQELKERQTAIKDKALLKLMRSLDLIDDEKLVNLSAKDLSHIGSNLAKVAHSMTDAEAEKSPINILVYAPELRDEKKFKVIDV